MQKRKERAFNEHEELIRCVWYIGKGIMFRKHLVKYFTLHGHRKKNVEEAIRDLIDSDLIEVYRYANSHVLKLKKYGIYMLSNKKYADVDSVTTGGMKFLRSAFLNERILMDLAQEPYVTEKGFERTLYTIKKTRTHSSFEKQSYEVLRFLLQIETQQQKKGANVKYLKNVAIEEIRDLRIVRVYAENGKMEDEAKTIRMKKESGSNAYGINMNGLHSRDIYFAITIRAGQCFLDLDFLDTKSTMTDVQLEKKMKLALPYIKSLFEPVFKIRVHVLVASEVRHAYFESNMNRIVTNVSRATRINDFSMNIVNLDIDETLFARMTIIN